LEYPESFLVEVESGIMIRKVQGHATEHERGKTVGYHPAVAAALADGSRLVYVIVDNPQSEQMFQILVSKLGSFLDRQVRLLSKLFCPMRYVLGFV
jgi:hypothetical protein